MFRRFLQLSLNQNKKSMKAVKRNYFKVDELLRFDVRTNFEIERYFNPTNYDFKNNTLHLWFDRTFERIVDNVIVEAIYLDYSKNIEKYEAIEYVETYDVPMPKESIKKNNEFKIDISIKVETKVLWKIIFKIEPKHKFDLHISLS